MSCQKDHWAITVWITRAISQYRWRPAPPALKQLKYYRTAKTKHPLSRILPAQGGCGQIRCWMGHFYCKQYAGFQHESEVVMGYCFMELQSRCKRWACSLCFFFYVDGLLQRGVDYLLNRFLFYMSYISTVYKLSREPSVSSY